MSRYRTEKGVSLTLAPEPFSRGGEGAIFQITSSNVYGSGYCAKIYHKAVASSVDAKTKTKLDELERKILYMVAHQPRRIEAPMWKLLWPVAAIYDSSNRFVGMVMSLAFEKSVKLTLLTLSADPPGPAKKNFWANWTQQDWTRFNPRTANGLLNRLKLIANLCLSIYVTHSTKYYVFVDLKLDNILINGKGQLSLCDIDSIQIAEGGNELFPASARTPEFSPPDPLTSCFATSWDHFSLAVIIYKLLFLWHPFMGTCRAPYDECTTTTEKIAKGLYVHGTMREFFSKIHKAHDNLKKCPAEIGDFFFNAFDPTKGLRAPEVRPSAKDWGKMIVRVVDNFSLPVAASENIIAVEDVARNASLALEKFQQIAWAANNKLNVKAKIGDVVRLHVELLPHNVAFSVVGIMVLCFVKDDSQYIIEAPTQIAAGCISKGRFFINSKELKKNIAPGDVWEIRAYVRPKQSLAVESDDFSQLLRHLPYVEIGKISWKKSRRVVLTFFWIILLTVIFCILSLLVH